MAYLSLDPISAAIYTTLNVASLLALAPGGVYDGVPLSITYPFVLFEVSEQTQVGAFGPGTNYGSRPEVRVRVHVFTIDIGFQTANQIMQKVVELLTPAPTVSGYNCWAIFKEESTPLSGQVVAGRPVNELVTDFRLYVEEA
jgi:hypothetical protein